MILDFIISNIYDARYIHVIDASDYGTVPLPNPPQFVPLLKIEIPNGFEQVELDFPVEGMMLLDSQNLNISPNRESLPDGVYTLKYQVNSITSVEKSILKVDSLMEKIDSAFLKLDISNCDIKIGKQERERLNAIKYIIQAAISSANNCMPVQATELYVKANKMLMSFAKKSLCCKGIFVNFNY